MTQTPPTLPGGTPTPGARPSLAPYAAASPPPLPTWWRWLALGVQVGLVLSILSSVVTISGALALRVHADRTADGQDSTDLGAAGDMLLAVGILTWGTLLLVVGIAFITWLYVGSGARDLNGHPIHWRGWAITGWLVPILNLFRPYQMVAELHRRSGPGGRLRGTSPLALAWWLTFVAITVVNLYDSAMWERIDPYADIGPWHEAVVAATTSTVVLELVCVAAAVLGLLVVRRLTADVLALPGAEPGPPRG